MVVKKVTKKAAAEDKPAKDYEVVPGPAEEAEGTIHPPKRSGPKVNKDDIVLQVLNGEWGVGQDRRIRLAEAGHNPNEIQREIVRRANK